MPGFFDIKANVPCFRGSTLLYSIWHVDIAFDIDIVVSWSALLQHEPCLNTRYKCANLLATAVCRLNTKSHLFYKINHFIKLANFTMFVQWQNAINQNMWCGKHIYKLIFNGNILYCILKKVSLLIGFIQCTVSCNEQNYFYLPVSNRNHVNFHWLTYTVFVSFPKSFGAHVQDL